MIHTLERLESNNIQQVEGHHFGSPFARYFLAGGNVDSHSIGDPVPLVGLPTDKQGVSITGKGPIPIRKDGSEGDKWLP